MTIPSVTVNFGGPAPDVRVIVGNALQASYTIAVIPADHDPSRAISVAVARTADEVTAPHSLAAVWATMANGWVVSVYGGIAGAGQQGGYPVTVQLLAGDACSDFEIAKVEGAGAATFIAMIEVQS